MENLENRKKEIEKELNKLNEELTTITKQIEERKEEIQTFETIIICKSNIYARNLLKIKKDFATILQPTRESFNFENIDDMGIRQLAYEVKGNKDGYYIIFRYKSTASKITNLEKYIRENKQIIKFMTIKSDETI